jgi:hypothetical protein
LVGSPFIGEVPAGSQIDFQIQALTGHIDVTQQPIYFGGAGTINNYSFVGVSGDWSNTQTITIPETSSSASPNPTPTPTVPEFPSWIIPLLLTIMVASAGLLVYHKKHKHNLVKEV